MTLNPILFSARPDLVESLANGSPEGAHAVVVDWERRGKEERQQQAIRTIGSDTQITSDTIDDLQTVTRLSRVPVWCRLNAFFHDTRREVEDAVEAGVSEVLIPMVREPDQAERVLEMVDGRAGVGILIETRDSAARPTDFADLPLSRVYVGLMDLALERSEASIFNPFVDGTLELIREALPQQLGVGGLTVPGRGHPVPSHLLAGEILRLGYDFSFMRRSFIRDAGEDPVAGLASLQAMLADLASRNRDDVEADRAEFETVLGITRP